MSKHDDELSLWPLRPPQARALFRQIVDEGVVSFSSHAQVEMRNDDLQTPDCLNVLRAGVVGPAEMVKGQWRYQVSTQRMVVVVTVVAENRLRVVTAWRIER